MFILSSDTQGLTTGKKRGVRDPIESLVARFATDREKPLLNLLRERKYGSMLTERGALSRSASSLLTPSIPCLRDSKRRNRRQPADNKP
jgi:hypothetical protein